MEHRPMNRLVAAGSGLLLAAVLSAGCPDNIAQLCPAGSKSAGSFTLGLKFQTGLPDECKITSLPDGGTLDASVSLATTPAPRDSALCVSDSDAGPVLYLALSDSLRSSPLGDGGAFTFTSSTTVANTACVCSLSLTETIAGQLSATGDGGITYTPDGGLTAVGGYSGVVTDAVDGSVPDCHCNVPCTLRYDVTGTKQ
jgi:hypothetical protein